jgi:alpha-beta hydrolase superfamily lysophospholipase
LREAARLFGRPSRGLPPGLPLLVLVGGDDIVGGERSVRRLVRAYSGRSGLRDIRVIVYPGARHEVFNETNREDVYDDLVGWLGKRFAVRAD